MAIQQVLLAYGVGSTPAVTYATWNPADKGSAVVLSSGNLLATASGGMAYENARATIPLSGKQYWEVTGTWSGSGAILAAGLATSGLPLSSATDYCGADLDNLGMWTSDGVYLNGSRIYSTIGESSPKTYKFAFDASTGKLWVGDASSPTWYNSGNPDSGTTPIATMPAATYFPALTIASATASVLANFGASAFAGTVPSGFLSGVYT